MQVMQIGRRAGPWLVAVLVMLALAIVTSAASAQTLFTTQEDFVGWSGAPAFNVAPTATDLDGSVLSGLASGGGPGTPGSLQAVWQNGAFDYVFSQGQQGNAAFRTALGTSPSGGWTAASGVIAIDYTLPPPGSGNYFQLGLVLNYDGHFDQTFGGAATALGGGVFEQQIPYTIGATASSSYFQLGFIYNSNYTGTPFFVDNIHLVPEPVSLGLVSLVSLSLLRRRR
jgi:hypothetical protein